MLLEPLGLVYLVLGIGAMYVASCLSRDWLDRLVPGYLMLMPVIVTAPPPQLLGVPITPADLTTGWGHSVHTHRYLCPRPTQWDLEHQ